MYEQLRRARCDQIRCRACLVLARCGREIWHRYVIYCSCATWCLSTDYHRRGHPAEVSIRVYGRQLSRGQSCFHRPACTEYGRLLILDQLITRGDIKVFLPPIGSYCSSQDQPIRIDPLTLGRWSDGLLLRRSRQYVRSQQEARTAGPRRGEASCNRTQLMSKSLTQVQCNGSDVFGSDICTCRPYRKYTSSLLRDTQFCGDEATSRPLLSDVSEKLVFEQHTS